MFGAKPKPIEQTTTREIWLVAFAGTLFIGDILRNIGDKNAIIDFWPERCGEPPPRWAVGRFR
jgi:hypothetical protein